MRKTEKHEEKEEEGRRKKKKKIWWKIQGDFRKPRLADSFGFIEPAVYTDIWTKCYMDSERCCTIQTYELQFREGWRWRQLVTSYYCAKQDSGQ
jgi:hypothetical protein